MIVEREIHCFQGGKTERCRDKIAVEEEYELYINGSRQASYMCSPNNIEELAYGFLAERGLKPKSPTQIRIENGKIKVDGELVEAVFTRGEARFPVEKIISAVEALYTRGSAFRETGAFHGALCFMPSGEVLFHVEDVSRHCAVDKCIGFLAKSNIEPSAVGFAVSCRLTKSIVEKLASVGVRLVASKAAPTLQGIQVAEQNGITLIGFARNNRFNIYTHPERIIF
ncbi:MAG: formate dehydrogenase accessory sulfurtransferase FdhD [Thermofilum sp.]|nr:formate dehydrogenase accessory sulfurtransferase FdhD [Thermofilum sp.]